jgi:RNA-binding protein with serine-rich domain 1
MALQAMKKFMLNFNGPQQIVVERLTKNVNEDHLYEIFGEFGHIKDLDLPINRSCALRPSHHYIYVTEA